MTQDKTMLDDESHTAFRHALPWDLLKAKGPKQELRSFVSSTQTTCAISPNHHQFADDESKFLPQIALELSPLTPLDNKSILLHVETQFLLSLSLSLSLTHHYCLWIQGAIQELRLSENARAAEDQCEEGLEHELGSGGGGGGILTPHDGGSGDHGQFPFPVSTSSSSIEY